MMGVELDNSSPASHAMTQRRQQGHSYHSSGGHLSGKRETIFSWGLHCLGSSVFKNYFYFNFTVNTFYYHFFLKKMLLENVSSF